MLQAQKTAHISDMRNGSGAGVAVHFTGDMALKMKKDEFLCNKENKQGFIQLLTSKLEQDGCEVHQARGDAEDTQYNVFFRPELRKHFQRPSRC
jgi:hypothetical protein